MSSERELSLKEIQQAEFSVLKEVAQICDEKGFKYFLAYGTLLGAIRHQGFIPWDDDVDIMMLRGERDKLIRYLKTEYKGKLVVCDRCSTENYPYGIPRICDMSYKYVSTNPLERLRFKQGVFIDVYALDPCGNSREESNKLFKKVQHINWEFSCYLGQGSLNPVKSWIKDLIGWGLHIVKGPYYPRQVDKEIENTIKNNTSMGNKFFAEVSWAGNFKIYEREIFSESCNVLFNGCEFKVPKDYDAFLKTTYGNYWVLPPENKRTPHHSYKIYK